MPRSIAIHRPAAALQQRRAFSLIEALVALSITAMAGSVLLLSVDSTVESTTEAVRQTIAEGLAQQLLDEALTRRYVEPGFDPLSSTLGPSAWEQLGQGIERFNDADDFAGYVSKPAKGPFGEALGTGDGAGGLRNNNLRLRSNYFQNWRQRVEVYYANATDHSQRSNTPTAYRAIEVNIEWIKSDGAVIPLAQRKRIVTYVPN